MPKDEVVNFLLDPQPASIAYLINFRFAPQSLLNFSKIYSFGQDHS